jgi:hypothetical protein
VSRTRHSRPALVDGRSLILTVLARAPRGAVYLAVDLEHQRRCLLKLAERHATAGPDGTDAHDRLRREAEVLGHLAADPRFPAVYDLFEHREALYPAMEDVEGVSVRYQAGSAASRVPRRSLDDRPPSSQRRLLARPAHIHPAEEIRSPGCTTSQHYQRRASAAREIAAEYFAAERVLGSMLDRAGR